MIEFFNVLAPFETVLWYMAIFTSVVFIVQSLMILLGGDTDTDTETEIETEIETDFDSVDGDNAQDDAGKSFGWFSFKNLINFFLLFAWVGLSCLSYGLSTGLTLLISTLSGLCFVIMMILIFKAIKSLSQDNTPKLTSLIGTSGVVYLVITEKGKGKVNVEFGGSIKTLDAISEDGKQRKTGTLIKVSNITDDGILIVN